MSDLNVNKYRLVNGEMYPDPRGEWITYNDHLKALAHVERVAKRHWDKYIEDGIIPCKPSPAP